ncbi:MAG: SufD family Fe-S cluster assembly protein [Muribaculaceae bacterium]|nr:SufD family Fe-S cluster assembly protein [Muribaculaceae bacterium]
MSALDQYLELYREHHQLIDANGAGPLNQPRGDAYAELAAMRLPAAGSDNYENCDLEAMLEPDYGINLAKLDIDVNPQVTFRCDVPMLTESPMMLINDTFAAPEAMLENMPAGVEVGSLRKFALDYPEEVSKYYGKLADLKNPIAALNTLLVQDGLYLRVKRGVRLEKPLQLVNILENGMPLMAIRRLLIVVEEDAEARLLVCDHSQNPGVGFMDLEVVEIFAGCNSRFDYYNLEESTEKTTRLSALYLSQDAGSHVSIDGLTLYNGTTRNEYYTKFNGKHAELHLYGMGIEDEDRKVSTYSHINHAHPDCVSNELFKFSLDDRAKGAFTGRIYVAPGAVKTEAYQSNRNLVNSDEAQMLSRPELEIYNDDVKCSHGCAIGKPDEMQLFYMRTRGLDEKTAKLLLKQAFMADIIDKIGIPALRDRLHLMVERRFAGEKSACAGCEVRVRPKT